MPCLVVVVSVVLVVCVVSVVVAAAAVSQLCRRLCNLPLIYDAAA